MQRSSRMIYVDGQLLPIEARHVSALDRGFTLGDGVFETMRAHDGRVFRLSDHLRRLNAGFETIRLACPPSEETIRTALRSTLAASHVPDGVIRLTVTRGASPQRGLLPSPSLEPTLTVGVFPYNPLPESSYARGLKVAVSSIRRNETSPTSSVKSLNYLDSVLARMEAADTGMDDAILLNSRGDVCCGSASNVFFVTTKGLITPGVDSGILPGVMRQTVLDLARELGIPSAEPTIPQISALVADEAFLTNVVLGLVPIVRIDDTTLGDGKPGQVSRRLRDALQRSFEDYLEQV